MPPPESTYLIDTTFHIAYFFEDDDNHQAAMDTLALIRDIYHSPTLVTTDLVFQETINLVHRDARIRNPYERALAAMEIGKAIFEFTEGYTIDTEILFRALEMFVEKNQEGYSWEFTDCSSFVFIREIRIRRYGTKRLTIGNALSFDTDFRQAGPMYNFNVLP